MPCLNKKTFSEPLPAKIHKLPLPAFGEGAYVLVKEVNIKDAFEYDTAGKDDETRAATLWGMLANVLVDDSGNPLFGNGDEAKVAINLSVKDFDTFLDSVGKLGIEE